jgi:hypothetical protein
MEPNLRYLAIAYFARITMENFTPYTATLGGLLIGLSATMLMPFNGRIAGISRIFYAGFKGKKDDTAWRLLSRAGDCVNNDRSD